MRSQCCFGSTPSSASEDDGIWDQHDGALSTGTLLSSLPSDLARPADLDNEDHCSPWPTLGESAALDLSGGYVSWNLDIGVRPPLRADCRPTRSSYPDPSTSLPAVFGVSPFTSGHIQHFQLSELVQNQSEGAK